MGHREVKNGGAAILVAGKLDGLGQVKLGMRIWCALCYSRQLCISVSSMDTLLFLVRKRKGKVYRQKNYPHQ